MSALTIDLDDGASAGLTNIEDLIDRLGDASKGAVAGADKLTAANERGLTVIQKETVGLSKLADTGIQTFGGIATQAIKTAEAIEVATIKSTQAIATTAIKAGASIAKWSIGAVAAVKVADAAFGKHKKTVDEVEEAHHSLGESALGLAKSLVVPGAAASVLAAKYGLVGQAAEKAAGAGVKSLLGLSGYAAGAGIAIGGMEAIFARTGVKFKGMTEDISKQTDKQAAEFKKFTDEANELGLSLDDLAQSRGIQDVNKFLEQTFGVKTIEQYESNLDRINKAFGEFGGEIGGTLKDDILGVGSALGDMTRDFIAARLGVEDLGNIWKEFDKDVTRRADNLIQNLGHVKTGFMSVHDAVADFFTGDTGGSKRLREMKEIEAEQKKFNASIQDDLARLRVFNAQVEKADEARGEAARLASIKTIDGINRELAAMTERRQKAAAEGAFTEADAKKMFAQREQLMQRRQQLEQAEAERRAKWHGVFISQSAEELSAMDAQAKLSVELFNLEAKRAAARQGFHQQLQEHAQRQNQDIGLDAAKEQHQTQKDLTAERLKAQGATESQIKTQLAAMDGEFAKASHDLRMNQIREEFRARAIALMDERDRNEKEGGTQSEIAKRRRDLEMQADKLEFETKKRQLDEVARFTKENNSRELANKRQLELAKWSAEKERFDKLKAENDRTAQAAMQHFNPKQFMDSMDPNKVRKQLAEDRAKAAADAQMQKDRDLGEKGLAGDQAAARKWIENQRKVVARAKREAGQDFDSGNVQQGELAKAQSKVAESTINTFAMQGKLNSDIAKSMADMLTSQANQQTAIDNITQTIQAIINAQKGIKTQARASVTNTMNQQGSLN